MGDVATSCNLEGCTGLCGVCSPAEKTAQKRVPGRPFQKGGDPRQGTGKKGRSGRPANEFRASLRELVDDPKVRMAAKAILTDPKNRQFAPLWKAVVAQAHGNPAQPITGEGGEGPVEIAVTHEVIDPVAS